MQERRASWTGAEATMCTVNIGEESDWLLGRGKERMSGFPQCAEVNSWQTGWQEVEERS